MKSPIPKIKKLPKPLQKAYLLGYKRGLHTARKDIEIILEAVIDLLSRDGKKRLN